MSAADRVRRNSTKIVPGYVGVTNRDSMNNTPSDSHSHLARDLPKGIWTTLPWRVTA